MNIQRVSKYTVVLRTYGDRLPKNCLIFQLCFIMPKIKLYVCRILCENFIQIRQKNESYSLYNLSTLTLLPAVIFERAATHWRESRWWGNGVMYCFFLLNCPMIFLRTFLTCNVQREQVWQHTLVQYHSSSDGGRLRSV